MSSVLTTAQMSRVPPADSLEFIRTGTVDMATAQGLGPNIATSAALSDAGPAACCFKYDIIGNTPPAQIVSALTSMNLPFISASRLGAIVSTVNIDSSFKLF